jgi:hypothetical protein
MRIRVSDCTPKRSGSGAGFASYDEGMGAAAGGHRKIDQRSLALHRAIAEKLRADPGLLQVARGNLERWSLRNSRSQPYWDAWRDLLNRPIEVLLALLVEDSETMAALRQASPFAGVLSPAERWAIYARFDPRGRLTT